MLFESGESSVQAQPAVLGLGTDAMKRTSSASSLLRFYHFIVYLSIQRNFLTAEGDDKATMVKRGRKAAPLQVIAENIADAPPNDDAAAVDKIMEMIEEIETQGKYTSAFDACGCS